MIKRNELNQNIYLSTGNKKLKSTENAFYLIFNLPAVVTCPQRTSMCEAMCYARKAERLYPQVLPCREKNLLETRKNYFPLDMVNHIKYHLRLKKNIGKQCFFRWHESGDIFHHGYFYSMCQIAEALPEVKFLAYTKSIDIVTEYCKYFDIPENLTIRFSVWDDTKIGDIDRADKLGLPIYTAKPKSEILDLITKTSYIECNCICENCKKCFNPAIKKIVVGIY